MGQLGRFGLGYEIASSNARGRSASGGESAHMKEAIIFSELSASVNAHSAVSLRCGQRNAMLIRDPVSVDLYSN